MKYLILTWKCLPKSGLTFENNSDLKYVDCPEIFFFSLALMEYK